MCLAKSLQNVLKNCKTCLSVERKAASCGNRQTDTRRDKKALKQIKKRPNISERALTLKIIQNTYDHI